MSHSFWSQTEAVHTTREDDLRRKRSWRIPPEQLVQLREAAKKFEGTHNFHNFTVGRAFTERSCERYMKKIEVEQASVEPLDYLHWFIDIRSCHIRGDRVGQCYATWTIVHAPSSTSYIFRQCVCVCLKKMPIQIVSHAVVFCSRSNDFISAKDDSYHGPMLSNKHPYQSY